MKRVILSIIAAIVCSVSFAGDAEQRTTVKASREGFHKLIIVSDGKTNAVTAELLQIDFANGQKVTIKSWDMERNQLDIFAGDYPPNPDEKEWHQLVIQPGAANVINVSVKSYPKNENEGHDEWAYPHSLNTNPSSTVNGIE